MGALINTAGTQILQHYFNVTLFTARLGHLRNNPPSNNPAGNGQPIMEYFNPAGSHTLHYITTTLTHQSSQRGDKLIFLPDQPYMVYNVPTSCPSLEARWKYFLVTTNPGVLTVQTENKLRRAIYQGLSDASYAFLQFDCVDGTGLTPPQTITPTDVSLGSGKKYRLIVLQTPPMSATKPVALCPQ